MAAIKERSLFSSKVLDSRIKSANTQTSEKALGYFLGPCFVHMAYYAIAGTYLTQFYTDVLGITGVFLTFMPVFSKIFDAITNIVMGRVIDKTRTRQGKARPWILISGILMAITGILLYIVPRAGMQVQLVWIVVSYNLFFAFAFTIYNMSHTLMVPLSTRNTKQRDGLAMLTSTGVSMLPGLLVTIILPIMINAIGVGAAAQGAWITVMSILSILAIPATLLEYYFTKERVTEDAMAAGEDAKKDTVSFLQQMKVCFADPYWLIVIGFNICYQTFNFLSTNSMIYYSNWVVANSVEGGTGMQVLINAIGQAPLGLGIFILWPLVGKFGKRMVMMFGYGIGAIGSLMVLLTPGNVTTLLLGLVIKSFGALPTYCMAAMLAEALDHIEWKNGFRADGFSASVMSIIITVTAGIGQSIIIGGISAFGYIAPSSTTEIINQPDAMKAFFSWCFVGIPMIGYLIGSLLMLRYDVELKIPQISADITARHKAEAEARGEVYISPEEKAAQEIAEQERIAEEKRIEELREKCAKKGLDFDAEEAKYQAKLAEKKAKEEAKATKKRKRQGEHNMKVPKKKMRKGVKIVIIIVVVLLVAAAIPPAVVFGREAFHKGNDDQYSSENAQPLNSSPLEGKTIIFLGSSVTYGSAAKGESFVDYMVKRDGIVAIKEAVSGTTLVDETVWGKKSYIERMKTIDSTIQADAFICQLSTNDATMKKPLGEISDSFDLEDFDTQTVAGAIEYVIVYAKQTWDCPVIFYTGTQYKSEQYEKMVALLLDIQKKWGIDVLDLWNDAEMNAVSKADYNLYMVNGIHPSRAGYRDWWTPKFEAYLSEHLS